MKNIPKLERIKKHLSSHGPVAFLDNLISVYEVVDFLCEFHKFEEAIITSYSISEEATRCFIDLLEAGKIANMTCILDYTIKKHKLDQSLFIANSAINVFLSSIHAKLILLKGNDIYISIITSANLNKVNRYECFSVFQSKFIYDKINSDLSDVKRNMIPYAI